MSGSNFAKANEKIAEGVADGYKRIENGVVAGYKKIEDGVVNGFNDISDKFVDTFLVREGETIEDAKARIKAEQAKHEAEQELVKPQPFANNSSDIAEASVQISKAIAKASIEKSQSVGKRY